MYETENEFVFTGQPGQVDPTRCTMCSALLAHHHKSVVVFITPAGGIELRSQCEHQPVKDFTTAVAVLSSSECMLKFMRAWSVSLAKCKHN